MDVYSKERLCVYIINSFIIIIAIIIIIKAWLL